MKPMRSTPATLWALSVAASSGLAGYWLRSGEVSLADPIGLIAAFFGSRWFFRNGGLNPGYTDPAIEQNRQRREERRRERRRKRS